MTEPEQSTPAVVQTDRRWNNDLAARVIEQMSDAVMLVDLYGRILAVNDELCRRVGFPREELIGASPAIWHDSDEYYGKLTAQIIAGCLREGRWLGTVEYQSTAGQRRASEVLATTFMGSDGRVEAILSVSRDITGRRER